MLVVLQLLSLFLLVGLGFYVFTADPRKRANQTFAAFIAFLACWTIKDLIFWSFYPRNSTAGWWVAASFIIALFMQFSLAVFAWVFPENSRTPRRLAAILVSPALVFIPAAIIGLLWRRAEFEGDRIAIELTPLAYAFVTYVYLVFFYGAAVLWGKYRALRGTQQGQQVGAILWALGITGVLKTLANIILPFFGNYSLLPFNAIFVLPGVVIYAYAILNFRLFSLQTALKQFRLFPINYKVAVSIASVAVTSFVLFQVPIAWWAFRNGMDAEAWRRYLVFSIVSALIPNLLLLLFILRIISRPLQKITLAAIEVAKGGYGTEVDLRRSNDEIGILANSFNEMSRKMAADIAELKALHDQLIRAEKLAAMGTMAAGVAHEVNNPLASISSLVQMMRSQEGHSADVAEKLELISEQITRISKVTSEMGEFARTPTRSKGLVCLNEVIEKTVRLARFDRSFRETTVDLDLMPSLPDIYGDKDQLQQVVLNLLLNARDAVAGSGEIRITTALDLRDVVVKVSDNGKGVDQSTARSVFDPFFTTKPAGKGTGLGLSVCYGIISAHGGSVDFVTDEAIGTTFSLRLPAAREPSPA